MPGNPVERHHSEKRPLHCGHNSHSLLFAIVLAWGRQKSPRVRYVKYCRSPFSFHSDKRGVDWVMVLCTDIVDRRKAAICFVCLPVKSFTKVVSNYNTLQSSEARENILLDKA
jgi:hypothetical protein